MNNDKDIPTFDSIMNSYESKELFKKDFLLVVVEAIKMIKKGLSDNESMSIRLQNTLSGRLRIHTELKFLTINGSHFIEITGTDYTVDANRHFKNTVALGYFKKKLFRTEYVFNKVINL